jgi:hypothetical protein
MFNSLNLRAAIFWALMATPAVVAGADPAARTEDWLIEDRAGVLELRLAHAERRRPDGGVLRIDPNRRLVTWEGIPGELGCKQKLEVPFGRIRAVRDEAAGMLRLEVKGEAPDRWVFVPLPHAAWLTRASSSVVQGIAPGVRDLLQSPDSAGGKGASSAGSMYIGGSAAFAGPQTRVDIVPSEITSDVRRAVERIRQGLGRVALPSVQTYEAMHGRPVEVGIAELLDNPGLLEGRAVRVRGLARSLPGNRGLELADGEAHLRVAPQPEIAATVGAAARDWQGREVEVSGVVTRVPGSADAPIHEVAFWEYLGPDQKTAPEAEVRTVTMRDLALHPEAFAGQTVRVVGKFRGNNLSHDLPEPGPRGGWVIKSGRQSLWVVGHGPSGPGFSLNPHFERDTTHWVEVTGRVESKEGRLALRASAIALSPPAAFVWSGPRLRENPRPDVVFTLPLSDEEVPASEARLLVQFSAYMDEESFEGRVRLRYDDEPGPGSELRQVKWSYDDVRRVLIVDPREPLRAGATLEVLLMPGIADVYASPLEAPPGAGPEDPVRRLSWRVSRSPLAELPSAIP